MFDINFLDMNGHIINKFSIIIWKNVILIVEVDLHITHYVV
jgi:hypothetical protein